MMNKKTAKPGITLMEMTVVIAIAALLAGLSLPAMQRIYDSTVSQGSIKSMVGSAMSAARSIAIQQGRYAGIRFQEDSDGSQYMIFIVYEEPRNMGNLTDGGYRAMDGKEPIKLGNSFGVIDQFVRISLTNEANSNDRPMGENDLDDAVRLRDLKTFSVIFSPAGKLATKEVRIRNRDGYVDSLLNYDVSYDDIFNKKIEVDAANAMFYQDDHANLGLGKEWSRTSFVIYDKQRFAEMDKKARYSYLTNQSKSENDAERVYINPFTGNFIRR